MKTKCSAYRSALRNIYIIPRI